jgi:hypothetical protein
MSISLPTFREEGPRFIHALDSAAVMKDACLLDQRSPTITRLREKRDLQKDETVIT